MAIASKVSKQIAKSAFDAWWQSAMRGIESEALAASLRRAAVAVPEVIVPMLLSRLREGNPETQRIAAVTVAIIGVTAGTREIIDALLWLLFERSGVVGSVAAFALESLGPAVGTDAITRIAGVVEDAFVFGSRAIPMTADGSERIEAWSPAEIDVVEEIVPLCIFRKDDRHRFTYANQHFVELLGAEDARDVIGKTDKDFCAPELCREYLKEDDRVLAGATVESIRQRYRRKADHVDYFVNGFKVPVRTNAKASRAEIGCIFWKPSGDELWAVMEQIEPDDAGRGPVAAAGISGREPHTALGRDRFRIPEEVKSLLAGAVIGRRDRRQAAQAVHGPVGHCSRRPAVWLLASLALLAKKEGEQHLTRILSHSDPQVRRAAIHGLASRSISSQIDVTDRLASFLEDPTESVRAAAAETLGHVESSPSAIAATMPGLAKLLHDASANVRAAAAMTIGRIGGSAATPAILERLAEMLRDSDLGVRLAAAEAIGRMGGAAAMPALLSRIAELLRDPNAEMRSSAAAVISRIGSAVATPGILALLGGLFRDVDANVRSAAAEALGWLGAAPATPEILNRWITLLEDDDRVAKLGALRGLELLGHAVAKTEIPQRLIRCVSDPDAKVRSAALKALGAIGPSTSESRKIAGIVAQRLTDPDDSVRAAAAGAAAELWEAGMPPGVANRLAAMLDDPARSVREATARALDDLSSRGIRLFRSKNRKWSARDVWGSNENELVDSPAKPDEDSIQTVWMTAAAAYAPRQSPGDSSEALSEKSYQLLKVLSQVPYKVNKTTWCEGIIHRANANRYIADLESRGLVMRDARNLYSISQTGLEHLADHPRKTNAGTRLDP